MTAVYIIGGFILGILTCIVASAAFLAYCANEFFRR